MKYKIIKAVVKNKIRFIIKDLEGNIIDDGQGWGYKSEKSAERIGWYKFKGGRKWMIEKGYGT